MSIVNQAGAMGFQLRIKLEDNTHDFSPVCGLGCRIQQT